ncbi:MAG: hypothetical protein LUC93_12605 [Planctomycetaceae bacterium]|nr:hypothetical protein [Planctomycetaceae bacterium]
MSKVTLTQFSFNRGELDPALHGRSDWKYYYSGAQKLRNLIARPQGGATKRGGLRLIAPALDDSRASHLIPFRFSVEQSYMLEFADRRMRVIHNGGVVVFPEGHERAGQEVVVETPYPADVLPLLNHTQTADVMVFTHPGHPPRRLTRHDHHDWRFSRLLDNARTATPENLRITKSGGDGSRYVVTAFAEMVGESSPSDAVVADNSDLISAPPSSLSYEELYAWLRERDYSYMPETSAFHTMSTAELLQFLIDCGYTGGGGYTTPDGSYWPCSRPGEARTFELWWWDNNNSNLISECLYACDQGWAGSVRAELESKIDEYVAAYNAGLRGDKITDLAWDAVDGASGYRVYRKGTFDDAYRLIGDTTATAFRDDTFPTGSTSLPEEADAFEGVDDYPGVCAFFEQRLILARTNNKPTTFWGSDTGAYNAFTKHSPIQDTDCYEFTLASGEMNEIHWIVPLNDLLLGTAGGEWKAGGGGYAITPSNINARVQSWYGCSALSPVVSGRTVIFAGRGRRTIRSFSYSLEADGYSGKDLTLFASHLFSGRRIAAMCHQREPDGIVWVVMSDGALLSCTYAPEEEVVAWSRHETAGRFEACAALPDHEGGDEVYFCVERVVGGTPRRFIERLEDAADRFSNETDGLFLDCGLSYRGAPVGRVTGLQHLEGEQVACLADGSVFPGLTVANGAVELPDGFTAGIVHVGLPYAAELVTMELEPEAKETIRNRARFAVAATVRFAGSRDCLYSHSDGGLSEMKFRTSELPGRPVRLFSGDKHVAFSSPPGARTTRLRFVSETPTPFTLLGIVAEASCGQPA